MIRRNEQFALAAWTFGSQVTSLRLFPLLEPGAGPSDPESLHAFCGGGFSAGVELWPGSRHAVEFRAGLELGRAPRHAEDFGRQRIAFLSSHSLRVDSCRVKPRLSMHRRIMGGRRVRRSCKSAAHSACQLPTPALAALSSACASRKSPFIPWLP